MGETYDARKDMPGWSTADFDDSGWKPVDVTEKVNIKIESYPSVLVRKFQEIEPVKMTESKDGAWIYNMGTNFAGFVRVKVRDAQPGQKIVLRFVERLNPDGTIYTTNLRSARATDTYICKGGGTEVWQPRFTFHGFQYVELTGYPGKPGLGDITRHRADLRDPRGRQLRLLGPDGQHALSQHLSDAAGQLHRHPHRLPAARRAAGLDGRRPDLRPHRHVQHGRRSRSSPSGWWTSRTPSSTTAASPTSRPARWRWTAARRPGATPA